MHARLAAVTQLFYNDNWFHDWYYAAGFTESAELSALKFTATDNAAAKAKVSGLVEAAEGNRICAGLAPRASRTPNSRTRFSVV